MKLAHRVIVLTAMAIAALAPAATGAAAGAAPLGSGARKAAPPITVTATIPVGQVPNRAAVNPRTDTIYVTNFGDNTVSVISGRTDTVVATIPVGSSPIGIAANPRTTRST